MKHWKDNEKDAVKLYDLRSQERYLKKEITSDAEVKKWNSKMQDLSDNVVPTEYAQPALGLFDEETLKRIQKAFPY